MASTGKDEQKDPFDGEYVGNIWGWRYSLIGLALIVTMSGLMIYRHISLGVPFGEPEQKDKVEMDVMRDSLSTEDTLKQ